MSEFDAEIAELKEMKENLTAFTDKFKAIECPEGVERWPCADEFIAAAEGDRKGVTRFGRNPVVSTDA